MPKPDQIADSKSKSIQRYAGHISIHKSRQAGDKSPRTQSYANHPMAIGRIPKPSSLPHEQLIGIPTIEGLEFFNIGDIVRCEGLQKCTRILTCQKTDIISSYSIGKFAELLEGWGFFACHRSHLINLKFVKKYTREGYIFLKVHPKPIPLARRRKCEFLSLIRHL